MGGTTFLPRLFAGVRVSTTRGSGPLVADTICRTVELGLSIDNAADAGNLTHL